MRTVRELTVDRVMVHDVPRPHDPEELLLTERPVDLDDQLREYFRRKILESLRARGLEVVADETGDRSVREAAQAIVKSNRSLIHRSQRLAERLYEIQKQPNSAAHLAVIRGTVDNADCVVLLKLEREIGVRVRVNRVAGKQVIDLQYLRDLVLTDKTRVFKAAVLRFDDLDNADSMQGVVSDDQRRQEEGPGVAHFFLADFLGCRLRQSPEETTREFFVAAERFINDDVADPERKGRYQVALMARLEDASLDVRPRTFAEQHLAHADRPRFLKQVRDAGLDPDGTFEKDSSLIARKIAKFRMTFDHGMFLIGSREDLDERVRLPASDEPDAGVHIDDTIKRIAGR